MRIKGEGKAGTIASGETVWFSSRAPELYLAIVELDAADAGRLGARIARVARSARDS
jgi:hypothetical protein